MKKFAEGVCKRKKLVVIISCILLVLSFVGMKLTKINYDILVYLPNDIETIKGQNILTEDFGLGSYSIALVENLESKEIISLESEIKDVEGVNAVFSIYDLIGNTIPIEMLPNEILDKIHKDNTDVLMITFSDSTSAETTINAVRDIRKITGDKIKQGGMSSMVLDTMNLSEHEIFIYILIAVILCIIVLELSLDSYIVPIILLVNIGAAILFNLGTNIFFGQISYITKALVAVLQLGVTTDFSIFLYHSYESKKEKSKDNSKAMVEAIKDTFTSVTGSSLTTIAGFLVLCFMKLTLGTDLGIVMAKGVLLGVITVLTLFPSLLLLFDNLVEKTKHKSFMPNFNKLNTFIVNKSKIFFIIFIILLVPFYLAYKKVDVYYKIDRSLPNTLESITANNELKDKYNIVSPEIILLDKNLKTDEVNELVSDLEKIDGVDFILSFSKLRKYGITENMFDKNISKIFENDEYQALLLNSSYEIASDELNEQIEKINKKIKAIDKNAIIAGEGPLMKDLIDISDTDFNNVNIFSIICIFIILFIVLKSISLPFLLIITIESAIFVNMGISYFSGDVLPFVAPIVLGTIQLGATIDYAILMTTTYLKNRNKIKDKKSAMIETLNYVGPSILVSGMCFFAATFGVGVYSELEMVGSLCTLISRGAIISMVAVITILPSILLLFDKLILKTTLGKRNKMKKITKYAVLIIALCLTKNVSALSKSETVFTKLNNDGSINNTFVNVKLLNETNLDEIEDYSELKDILNINNNDEFENFDNSLVWKSKGKDVFYQGTTKKELPVSLEVTYKLNGKTKKLKDILGKKGHVTIDLKYTNKDSHSVLVSGVYEKLYTPFIVTVGTVIDSTNNSNVKITNGKVVTTGTKNILVGLALPGMYENIGYFENGNIIIIDFDTTKFELPSIYSVITPKLIELSDLGIFNKMDTIYNSVNELQKNMDVIEKGSTELKNGVNTLKSELEKNINSDQDTLSEDQISYIQHQTLNSLDSEIDYISDTAWNQTKEGLDNSTDPTVGGYGTTAGSTILAAYLGGEQYLQDYMVCADQTGTYPDDVKNAKCVELAIHMGVDYTNPANIQTMLMNIHSFQTTMQNALTTALGNTSYYVAENVSRNVAVSSSKNIAYQVSGNVAKQVANQVKNESINTVYSYIDKLNNGVNSLAEGISKYNKEGINKLSSLSNQIVQITDKIGALIKLSNDYNTFSGTLDDTNSEAKFILVIDGEKVKEKTKKEVKKEKKESIWDRLGNLFN